MGSPADVILKAADDTASDLIVIGARGAGALPRLASHFGSVAHKIVCRAVCPVLTVRPLTDRDLGAMRVFLTVVLYRPVHQGNYHSVIAVERIGEG